MSHKIAKKCIKQQNNSAHANGAPHFLCPHIMILAKFNLGLSAAPYPIMNLGIMQNFRSLGQPLLRESYHTKLIAKHLLKK
jgi:hypothetical protein